MLVISLLIPSVFQNHIGLCKTHFLVLQRHCRNIQTSLLQSTTWPIAAEISSIHLRQKSLSIAVLVQTFTTWLTQFVVPYMYNVDSGNLGARTGFVFAGITIVLGLFLFFLTPEPRGMTIEEIDRAYSENIPTMKIRKGCIAKLGGIVGTKSV